jgi:transposase
LLKLHDEKESVPVPAIQPYIIEPIWEQFYALLPEREVNHPLGCHRSRIPDRIVFEKLLQVLVSGCAYWRIADESCSDTTLRRRRDEWIALGVMEELREMALEAYDRVIGLKLADIAVDGCITKAPCGGERAGKSLVDRGKQGIKRSTVVDPEIPLRAQHQLLPAQGEAMGAASERDGFQGAAGDVKVAVQVVGRGLPS